MTVKELIAALQEWPQDMVVVFCGDDMYTEPVANMGENESGQLELFT